MRILLVNKYARVTGGADTHCLALARSLTERGHEVALLSTSHPTNIWQAGAFVPLTVSSTTKATVGVLGQIRAAGTSMWSPAAYRATQRLIARFRPDVVNAHKLYPQLSVSPIVAARRAGVPVIQTVQDYEFVSASPYDETGSRWDADESALRFRSLNAALFIVKRSVHRRCVDRWLTVSEYVRARLEEAGIQATVIPNIAPPVQPVIRPRDERVGVAFAGRLSTQKGIEDVLHAAELLPDVPFQIAGDGPERELVERRAVSLENVEYLGAVSNHEVVELFGRAIVVLVPSTWQEPGALVTLEAMSVGTPLVVYRVGGIAEYVTDAKAGMVVDRDPTELARACRSLVGDRGAWQACSTAGLHAASNRYSAAEHCAEFLRVVKKVVT